MAKQKDWRNELGQVAEFLRDPFKMRMAVAGAAIVLMYFVISEPMQAQVRARNQKLTTLKNNVQTAQQIMLLRDYLEPINDRIFEESGNDAIISHLMDLVRGEAVDVMRIDARPPQKLGQLKSVQVSLDVTGDYGALVRLLHRIDSDSYLIRVENLGITPPGENRSASTMNMMLRVIKEKA